MASTRRELPGVVKILIGDVDDETMCTLPAGEDTTIAETVAALLGKAWVADLLGVKSSDATKAAADFGLVAAEDSGVFFPDELKTLKASAANGRPMVLRSRVEKAPLSAFAVAVVAAVEAEMPEGTQEDRDFKRHVIKLTADAEDETLAALVSCHNLHVDPSVIPKKVRSFFPEIMDAKPDAKAEKARLKAAKQKQKEEAKERKKREKEDAKAAKAEIKAMQAAAKERQKAYQSKENDGGADDAKDPESTKDKVPKSSTPKKTAGALKSNPFIAADEEAKSSAPLNAAKESKNDSSKASAQTDAAAPAAPGDKGRGGKGGASTAGEASAPKPVKPEEIVVPPSYEILHEGRLLVREGTIFKALKSRTFVLSPTHLRVYKLGGRSAILEVPVPDITEVDAVHDLCAEDELCRFSMTLERKKERSLLMFAPSLEEANNWLAALQAVIRRTNPSFQLTSVARTYGLRDLEEMPVTQEEALDIVGELAASSSISASQKKALLKSIDESDALVMACVTRYRASIAREAMERYKSSADDGSVVDDAAGAAARQQLVETLLRDTLGDEANTLMGVKAQAAVVTNKLAALFSLAENFTASLEDLTFSDQSRTKDILDGLAKQVEELQNTEMRRLKYATRLHTVKSAIARESMLKEFSQDPRGWLSLPNFKKTSDIPTWHKNKGDVSYKKQWVWLDGGLLRWSKKEGGKEAGCLNLAEVTHLRSSLAPKAPPNTFDLVGDAKIYSLVASSEEEKLKWAHAITEAAVESDYRSKAKAAGGDDNTCPYCKAAVPDYNTHKKSCAEREQYFKDQKASGGGGGDDTTVTAPDAKDDGKSGEGKSGDEHSGAQGRSAVEKAKTHDRFKRGSSNRLKASANVPKGALLKGKGGGKELMKALDAGGMLIFNIEQVKGQDDAFACITEDWRDVAGLSLDQMDITLGKQGGMRKEYGVWRKQFGVATSDAEFRNGLSEYLGTHEEHFLSSLALLETKYGSVARVVVLRMMNAPNDPFQPPRFGDVILTWSPGRDSGDVAFEDRKNSSAPVVNRLIQWLADERVLESYTVRVDAARAKQGRNENLDYSNVFKRLFQQATIH